MRSSSAALLTQDDTNERAAAIGNAAGASAYGAGDACGPLDYAIVSTRDDFDRLASEWNELFARAGRGTQLFQTFGWCWHWCNHYLGAGRNRSLAIVTGRRDGRLVLVWPLIVNRTAGLVRLSALGDPVSQYSDALIEPSPDAALQLTAAWQSLLEAVKPDVAWLPHVREDASIAPIIHALGGLAAQRQKAPYVDLGGMDRDALVRHQSARRRKKQRAAARRLAKAGAVSFVAHADGAQAAEIAAAAVDMKRRQLAERGILSPAFADRRLRDFFTCAALGRRQATGARVLALDSNGEHAAIDVLLGCKDRVATHVVAYDQRFSKENVGWQLLGHAITVARAEGYRTFDMLAPADAYKMRWADGTVDVIDWVVPISKKGAVFARLYPMLIRPLLKRLAHSAPQRLRRLLTQRYYRHAAS